MHAWSISNPFRPSKNYPELSLWAAPANLLGCLESVKWADEILVVDSFSNDASLEIARRYTDRILQHEYINSAAQKNWAIPKALHEWVLVVDCDERVTPSLRDEIRELLREGPQQDGYWIYRDNYLFERLIKHSGWGRDRVLRLFRRDLARYDEKRVHAEVEIQDPGVCHARLSHYSIADMRSWVNKINRYSSWKAEDKCERGVTLPLLHLLFRPPIRFIKDFIFRRGILDGWRGFLIASMAAFAELIMSAKLIQGKYYNK
jgi:glycosyltransferase involved in cell wall biosynthesis